MANIATDIKDFLEFYRALGFEKLAIKLKAGNPISAGRPQTLNISDSSFAGRRRVQSKEAALEALREEIGDCKRCKLSGKRTHLVFGEGSPDARLMFIGEAPGREEDLQARPFVGEAGKLLTRLIEKMGFRREDVYIANIVKCRPPQNRDPEPDEVEACIPFLKAQILAINPKVIVALGRVAASALTERPIKITKERGIWLEYMGIPLMPTYHPSYLLRNPPGGKRQVWEDIQAVLNKLGLPIPD